MRNVTLGSNALCGHKLRDLARHEVSADRSWRVAGASSAFWVHHQGNTLTVSKKYVTGEQGWRSGESTNVARVPFPDLRHMWVEFVVDSRSCSERFFSGYSGFSLSSKTNISKFQFDMDYCQVFYHEPLAQEIAQAPLMLLT